MDSCYEICLAAFYLMGDLIHLFDGITPIRLVDIRLYNSRFAIILLNGPALKRRHPHNSARVRRLIIDI